MARRPDYIQSHITSDADVMREMARMRYYRLRPDEWKIRYLGFKRESILWSENPEYAQHRWDSRIILPTETAVTDPRTGAQRIVTRAGAETPLPNAIAAIAQRIAAGDRRIAVESCAGSGKSYDVAGTTLWYIDVFRPSLVKTYAPKMEDLQQNLWGYIGEMWPRFKELHPQAEITKEPKIYMQPDSPDRERWAAMPYATQAATGSQTSHGATSSGSGRGAHAKYMLLVMEEANAIDKRIHRTLRTTAGGPHNTLLTLCNPDSAEDAAHEFWDMPSTTKIRISGFDTPNYVLGREAIPGGFSRDAERDLLEDPDVRGNRNHPFYLSRSQGICPAQSGRTLFDATGLDRVEAHFRPLLSAEEAEQRSLDAALLAAELAA